MDTTSGHEEGGKNFLAGGKGRDANRSIPRVHSAASRGNERGSLLRELDRLAGDE